MRPNWGTLAPRWQLTFRPVCPQMRGLVESQNRGWGDVKGGPVCPPLEENELECLRLTITAPAGHKVGQQLPVMVWIHGYVSPYAF
jgi:carboxylesterase type B